MSLLREAGEDVSRERQRFYPHSGIRGALRDLI